MPKTDKKMNFRMKQSKDLPSLHNLHVDVPVASVYLPGGQSLHPTPISFVYLPTGQSIHFASVALYVVPSEQKLIQSLDDLLPGNETLPEGHAEHVTAPFLLYFNTGHLPEHFSFIAPK